MNAMTDGVASPRQRYGGALLALGCMTFLVTIVLYVFVLGADDPGSPEAAAAHLLENLSLARGLWYFETIAISVLAIAGFALQDRSYHAGRGIPGAIGWIAFATGALINAGMYALVLGAYEPAAQATDTPELFASLQGAATILFLLGNALMYLGLAIAMAAEMRARTPALSPIVAAIGAASCALSALLSAALIADLGSLPIVAPFALAGFAFATWFGFRLSRQSA